jgi:WD40 repeat protein
VSGTWFGGDTWWSRDGSLLAHAKNDGIDLINSATGEVLRTSELSSSGKLSGVAFSPDNKSLAIGDHESWIGVYGLDSQQWLWRQQSSQLSRPIHEIVWSFDGSMLASIEPGNVVRLRDAGSGDERWAVALESPGGQLDFSPDGRELVHFGSKLSFFQVDTGKVVHHDLSMQSDQPQVAWFAEEDLALSTRAELGIWDIASESFRWRRTLPHTTDLVALAAAPDGTRLASGAALGGIRIWETETGRHLATLWMLRDEIPLVVSADGHFRGGRGVEQQLVYIIRNPDGSQETLAPKEFSARFGWKNDPSRARFASQPDAS